MTITRHPGYIVRGESSDTKPTTGVVANLSTFIENNTGKRSYWTGTEWIPSQLQKLKEYYVFNVGATTYVTERATGRIANSNTDTQLAVQAVFDSMVHGDWFKFYWDAQRFTLNNPLQPPKSISFTTLKHVDMYGASAYQSSGVSAHGTQFVCSSAFPNQRYMIEALAQDADVDEYIALHMDGFSFDNREYGRSKIGNVSIRSNPTFFDAGAIKIRNAAGYGSQTIDIRNIHTMFVWRALHLEGAVVAGRFENFFTEDDTNDSTADLAFVGDNLVQLQGLSVPTFFNSTPKYCYFGNFKRFGQGRYNNWLRMHSGSYNTFIDIFPDGGRFEESMFNLDNTQDIVIDSGLILSGNAFYHLQALDLNHSGTDNRKGGTLYLNGSSCVANTFHDCLLPNYPNMVKIANGAARNTIYLDGFVTVPGIIDDVGAGIGNTVLVQGGFKVGGSDSIVKTTAGLVRLIDLRAVAFNGGDELISDGTHWWLKGPPSMLSNRKWGAFLPGQGAITTYLGILATWSGATGSTSVLGIDSTFGKHLSCPTPATTGSKGGIRVNSSLVHGSFDPKIRIRFKLVSTTNMRLYLGLCSVFEPTGDDPLGVGQLGVLFGFRSTDTNFQWMRNDTAGPTQFTDTGVAKDTNMHDIRIVVSEGGIKYNVSLDGGAYTVFTTEIPGTSNILTAMAQSETTEAVAKTFQLYNIFMQTEK